MLTMFNVQCSSLVGCVTMSLDEWFCTFNSIMMPSRSVHVDCWTLTMKALLSFETSQTSHTTMQHHILSHTAGETSNMTQYCVLVMQGDIHHERRQTAVGCINGSVCYITTLPTATSYSAGDKQTGIDWQNDVDSNNEVLMQNPIPVPRCPIEIQNRVTWD